jgi:hypothetical protein
MLVVCSGCNRHVREETCPFCGAPVDPRKVSARPLHHATRAALAFGTAATAVGVTLAGCAPALPYGTPAGGDEADSGRYDSDATAYGLHDTGVPEDDASPNGDASADATDAAVADADEDANADSDAGTDAADQ